MKKEKLKGLGEYRTIADWAATFGVAENTLGQWIRSHDVTVKKLGYTPLVTLEDLGQYKVRVDIVRKLLAGEL